MIHLLLVILSVMTWTVESKNTVRLTDGSTAPYDLEASYTNTYNKGQLRLGDEATLTLKNMGGVSVERVSLAMRANEQSGAGYVEVEGNGMRWADKGVAWHNVSADVEVYKGHQPGVETMTIRVTGVQNSIYVDAFTIEWSPPAAQQVVLMKGATPIDTLWEEQGMNGVVLPRLQDEDHWRFRGWSKEEFWTVYDEPTYLLPETRYYPDNDVLWAVYQWEEADTKERNYEENLESGVYMYVNRITKMALTGVPENGRMHRADANVYDANQHYELTFTEDNTVYITHVPTGTPIGYSGTQMAAKASPWNVYHQGDQTLFYTTINGKNYVLWLENPIGNYEGYYAGLFPANPGESPMGLLGTMMPTEIYAFTCHPEAMVGIESVQPSELRIQKILRDGQVLILRQGETYTMTGMRVKE